MRLRRSATRLSLPGPASAWLLLAIWFLLLSGCATYTDRLTEIRTVFYAQDLLAADQLIADGLKRPKGNEEVLKLERAMTELAGGEPWKAEQTLREVRDRLDYLEQVDVGELTLAYLTDDKRRGYAGEDYEKVLIRAFLALSNLLHDGDDAGAYCLQMMEKQERIIAAAEAEDGTNPKRDYPRVALAPYLQGMLQEATHRAYDDAERSYAAVVSWQPDFLVGQQDWQRAVSGRHSAPGHGVLYVFALTGRGPYKEEVIETPTSDTMLIASLMLNQLGKRNVTPNIAPVKVPLVVAQPNSVASVSVSVNGQPIGTTATITDVSQLALRQYEAVYPTIVARAVVRRCVKKGVVYGAQEVADIPAGSLSSLAMTAAGVVWEATESADTRCWGLLPDKIQVLRVELPAGEYRVGLQPQLAPADASAQEVQQTASIADGRNTYLLATFPGSQLVGKVVTHQP